MSQSFPYTYISCPCSDESSRPLTPQRASRDLSQEEDVAAAEEEEKPFNPHHPRSNYSLFPPEYLFYCEECHDLKCPRCSTEEIVCWYCPSCLFETPSSMLRSEGNRCGRNCFNCPICTSQLTVNTLTDAKEGPWILNCNYCMWTSLDIGIKFDRPTNIRSQLDKIANGGKPRQATRQSESSDPSRKSSLAREPFSPSSQVAKHPSQPEATDPEPPLDPTARFATLKSFYKSQLSLSSSDTDSTPTLLTAADLAYSSPSSLTRIVNLYTTHGTATSFKRPKSRTPIMREALTQTEGLLVPPPQDPAAQSLTIMHFSDTASLAQKAYQQSASGTGTPRGRLVADLRPMPALLRTKRAKRCAACRHILAKPDFKVTSTRYKIKLTALNYIPLVTLRPIARSGGEKPALPAGGDHGGGNGGGGGGGGALQPQRPYQWVVTLKNHLFDAVKVSLATPAVTPGRLGHRVTVLCPQFEVGANGDVWDDALGGGGGGGSAGDKRLSVAVAPSGPKGETGVAEAGKVYDKGRNWASVVLEVVPVGSGARRVKAAPKVRAKHEEQVSGESAGLLEQVEDEDEDELEGDENEDDDVIEIPIRVRLEWRQSDAEDGDEGKKKAAAAAAAKVNEEGEVVDEAKRALAYWMVLGVGRVGS